MEFEKLKVFTCVATEKVMFSDNVDPEKNVDIETKVDSEFSSGFPFCKEVVHYLDSLKIPYKIDEQS